MSSVAFTVRDVSSREEAEVLSFLLLYRRRLKSNAKNNNNNNNNNSSNGIRGERRRQTGVKKGKKGPDGLVFSVVTVASMIAREERKR